MANLIIVTSIIIGLISGNDATTHDGITRKLICEGDSATISCEDSLLLNILFANFGRLDLTTCNEDGNQRVSNTSCRALDSLARVKEVCQDKSSCSVEASKSFSSLGDPCADTHKYLEINYICVSDMHLSDGMMTPQNSMTKMTICEHDSKTISCETPLILDIKQANYGRLDATSCNADRNQQVHTTSCRTPDSLKKIKEICQDQSSCVLKASNSLFGDPCPYTNKYLEINYTCVLGWEESHHVTPLEIITEIAICERDTGIMSCVEPFVLDIKQANYGRLDKTTCNKDGKQSVRSVNCKASDTLDKVKEKCQDKSSCSLTASNSFSSFGDPCVGTVKYLEVNYSCVASSDWMDRVMSEENQAEITDHMTERTICEGDSSTISCEGYLVLDIKRANYGRLDATTCNEDGNQPSRTTSCQASDSLKKVREICQDQSSCSLEASNSWFGDPCLNTYKYLDVSYKCVPSWGIRERLIPEENSIVITICEHYTTTINCEGSFVLDIKQANYGRLDSTTCNEDGNQPVFTTACQASDSQDRVREICQTKSSCSLMAANSRFGDPCAKTYKYLEVSYTCVAS